MLGGGGEVKEDFIVGSALFADIAGLSYGNQLIGENGTAGHGTPSRRVACIIA